VSDPGNPLFTGLPISRRRLLARGLQLGSALPAAGLIAACGSSSSSSSSKTQTTSAAATAAPLSGTLTMINYPSWIGAHEVANFEKLHPQVKIKQVAGETSSVAQAAVVLHENPHAYDFLLADVPLVGQLKAAGQLGRVDLGLIPNLSHVAQQFKAQFPYGIPTDLGKVGLGYRADLMTETPTSWHDVWRLAPKYSGKVVFVGLDQDCMGNACRYLGYSVNTTDPKQLTKVKDALIQIKPHIQAFPTTNVSRSLVQGSAVMTMSWDFDIAAARHQQPHIKWVIPEEGVAAYLEGWVGVAGSPKLNQVAQFMNFHLEPRNYADFINTTDSAFTEPNNPFIEKKIADDPILKFDPAVLKRVQFEGYIGQARALWEQTWSEVQAA
jgi:spermidine/putrescine transport system substrate-binding protein